MNGQFWIYIYILVSESLCSIIKYNQPIKDSKNNNGIPSRPVLIADVFRPRNKVTSSWAADANAAICRLRSPIGGKNVEWPCWPWWFEVWVTLRVLLADFWWCITNIYISPNVRMVKFGVWKVIDAWILHARSCKCMSPVKTQQSQSKGNFANVDAPI